MKSINRNKLKIIVPVVLGIGILISIGVNSWLNNRLETEELQSQLEIIQEKDVAYPSISENNSSNSLSTENTFEVQEIDEDDIEPKLDWEEPPVPTVYNPAADLNTDGTIDKSEWEKWVANNPADLDQDLNITEEEKAEFNKPTTPAQGNTGSGGNTGGSGNNTNKPTPTPKPTPKPTPPTTSVEDNSSGGTFTDDELDNWGKDKGSTIKTEDYIKPIDPIN